MSGAGRARLPEEVAAAAARALEARGLDGWLLYDLEGRNRMAAELLGIPEGTSRRHFVLLRPDGPPVALVHGIESQTWEDWEGELVEYVGWEEMESELRGLLEGCDRVAMEVSERDAVPFVDFVPAGVVELVEGFGVRVVGSAELISRAYARWGERGRALHGRAGRALAGIAREACERAAEAAGTEPLDEAGLAGWIRERAAVAGLAEGDVIVAAGPNSALPHYAPPAVGSRTLSAGEVLLVDLWGRVEGEPRAVFADQTWMAVLGDELPDGFGAAWDAVRAARDGAVEFIAERAEGGELPTGAEVDRRARQALFDRGYDEEILHRTGHAMDRVNHGFGPNLDSIETRDERRLVEGIGFSVEPGLYFHGRWGIRSEINVYVGPDGPEVTTPDVQDEAWTFDV